MYAFAENGFLLFFFFERKLNPEYIPASTKTHFVPRYFAISSTFR